jgi:hypothetical protein
MRLSNIVFTSVATAAAASYYYLSPICSKLNEVAQNCIKSHLPRDDVDTYRLLHLFLNPIGEIHHQNERYATAGKQCITEVENASNFDFYSTIAISALVVSAGILTYRLMTHLIYGK